MPGVADNQKPNWKGREGLKLVLASPSGEKLAAVATVTVPTYPDPTSANERVYWITDFDTDFIRAVIDQVLAAVAKDSSTDITFMD